MPPLLLAAAAIVGSTSLWVGAMVIAAAVVTLSSVAYSAYMMASMQNPHAPDAATRLQTVRSAIQPHRVVYGTCMTGGVLVYAVSHQKDPETGGINSQANEFISLVVAFTGHQIDAIEEVWLNDKQSTDASFARTIPGQDAEGYMSTDGNGNPVFIETRPAVPAYTGSYVSVTKYLGTLTQQADPFLCSLNPKPSTFITSTPSSGLNDLVIINNSDGSGTFTGVGVAVFDINCSAVSPSGDTFHWTKTVYAGDGSIVNNAAAGSHTIAAGSGNIAMSDGIVIGFSSASGHSIGQSWEVRAFDGSPWTSHCTLTNRSYVVVTLAQSNTVFPNGLPNIKALIRGNNQIYDPRTGTTGYTDNWALCIRDYLVKPFGLNTPTSGVNDSISIAAANICDEQILLADGTYQPNYVMNGSFTLDKTPTAIMNEMLATAYGARAWTQGKYRILPAAYYAPVMNFYGMNQAVPGLTESDLRGPIKFRPTVSMKDKFNTVTGTYISPETWQPVDFPKVTNTAYVAQDGQEIIKDIQLTHVTNSVQAQRVAKIMLEKSRIARIMEFPAKWSAFPLAIGDNVPISIGLLGMSQEIFTVINWKMSENGGVDLTLQLDDASCYSWDTGQQTTIDLSQFTILPDPRYVAKPLDVTTSVRRVDTNTGTLTRMDLIIVWTPGDASSVTFQVQYQDPVTLQWLSVPDTSDTIVTISGLADGDYNVRVRAMNAIGATSDWATSSQYVPLPDATVPNVTGLEIWGQGNNAVFTGRDVKLRWNQVNPRTNTATTDLSSPMKAISWFRCYEVKISTSLGVLLRTEDVITEAYTYTYESNRTDTGGSPQRNLHIEVRAVATWGDKSSVADAIDVSNPAPAKLTGLVLIGAVNLWSVGLPVPSDSDFAGFLVNASQTTGFTPGISNQINTGGANAQVTMPNATPGVWYVRAAAYDSFGPDSLNYSDQYQVTVTSLTITANMLDAAQRVDFYIRDSNFYFTGATLNWGVGYIDRGASTYTLGAGTIANASGGYVIATLNDSSGIATLSFSPVGTGLPSLSALQIIIAVTSDWQTGQGNYICFVRQANSASFEGALIRDATITDAKITGTLSANKIQTLNGSTQISGTGIQLVDINNTATAANSTANNASSTATAAQTLANNLTSLSLVARNSCVVTGNTFSKPAGATAWDSDIYSKDGFTGGCYCSWVAPLTTGDYFIALSSNPSVDSGYVNLNYSVECYNNSLLYIYETGTMQGSTIPYSAGDQISILYDGASVRYMQNGTVIRTVTVAANMKLYLDSSFRLPGSVANNVQFGPLSSNDWGSLGNIPARFGDAPVGSGLSITPTHLGFYNGSAWKTYMDSSGDFYLSGAGTHGLSWDGTSLNIRGNLTAGDIQAGGTITGSTIQTASNGQRITLDLSTHSLIYYGSDGTSVLVEVGGNSLSINNCAATFGNALLCNTGVLASGSNMGLISYGLSSNGVGVQGSGGNTGVGVIGSSNNIGIQGIGAIGVQAQGTLADVYCNQSGVLRFKQTSTLPTRANCQNGDFCIAYISGYGTYIPCYFNNGHWYAITGTTTALDVYGS